MVKKKTTRKRVTKRKATKKKASRRKKVCNACGEENPLNAQNCRKCGKDRFAPAWILAKRNVNRQVSVEITRSNPAYGASKRRITLSKWWPGGRATFHIPNTSQWERISQIIDDDLGPILNWKDSRQLIKDARSTDSTKRNRSLHDLATEHPDFLKQLVAAIDPEKLATADMDSVVDTFGEISDALTNANAGFREAFLSVVKKLPRQKQRALEDLDLLLKGWSLQVITNVAQQVRARLETIELFEKQIQDPRTFEIKGDNSIHRILERAMWLVDERYWLLYSNETLRKQIGEEMSKRDKKRYGKKRPDFVCGKFGNRLIILELKRPAHSLCVDDLNQLETYITVAEQYFSFSSYEAYLVGSKSNEELLRRLKHRSRSFKVLTYADLIDATKKRYYEYLQAVDSA